MHEAARDLGMPISKEKDHWSEKIGLLGIVLTISLYGQMAKTSSNRFHTIIQEGTEYVLWPLNAVHNLWL